MSVRRRNVLAVAALSPFVLSTSGCALSPAAGRASAQRLQLDAGGDWRLDGHAFQFFAGELHPSRIPHEYWENRIQLIKALGCNAVSVYLMPNFHETSPGVFDLHSPAKAIAHFVDLCATHNLWVVLRTGPYVCGEWDFGGLPARFLTDPDMRLPSGELAIRTSHPAYQRFARQWMSQVWEQVLRGRTLADGGSVILLSLENEYTSWIEQDAEHIRFLHQTWIELGYRGKFCVCEGWADSADFWQKPGVLTPDTAFGLTAEAQDPANYTIATRNYHTAVFGAEVYPGWLTHWGDQAQPIQLDSVAATVKKLFLAKRSFMLYVAHGGTNFGFWAGANGEGNDFQSDITSYDYGAPISESGKLNGNYHRIRNMAAAHFAPPAPLPALIAHIREGALTPVRPVAYALAAQLISATRGAAHPMTYEQLQQPFGLGLYRTRLPAVGEVTLSFSHPQDFAVVLLNGQRVGPPICRAKVSGWQCQTLTLYNDRDYSELSVLTLPFGRINFGAGMKEDAKGIRGQVLANGVALTDWHMGVNPCTDQSLSLVNAGLMPVTLLQPALIHQPFFALVVLALADSDVADLFIDMSNWGTGYVWVNGHNLGRYWPAAGPQRRLYCPGVWLKAGANRIWVLEMVQSRLGSLSFWADHAIAYVEKQGVD